MITIQLPDSQAWRGVAIEVASPKETSASFRPGLQGNSPCEKLLGHPYDREFPAAESPMHHPPGMLALES